MGDHKVCGCSFTLFLLSNNYFFTTFLTTCGWGDRLRTVTCVDFVVGGKQVHAPCKILLFRHVDHKTVPYMGQSLATLTYGGIAGSVCLPAWSCLLSLVSFGY